MVLIRRQADDWLVKRLSWIQAEHHRRQQVWVKLKVGLGPRSWRLVSLA